LRCSQRSGATLYDNRLALNGGELLA
jgi:hypothetical protein